MSRKTSTTVGREPTDDIWTAMYTQRAIRYWQDKPVPRDLLKQVIEAASKAPSGSNTQPWVFVVVDDAAKREAIAAALRGFFEGAEPLKQALSQAEQSPNKTERLMLRGARAFFTQLERAPVLIIPCLQPESAAVLTRDRFLLFVQPRDPRMETWNGRRPGTRGAIEQFGADEAYPIDQLGAKLPSLIENRPRLLHSFGLDREIDEVVLAAQEDVRSRVRRGVTLPSELVSPHALIHEMRMHKSEAELAVMRAAAAISCEAHHAAARLCHPGRTEYEIQAELEWIFRKRGGSGPAYSSIVGSGDNATILHYIENSDTLVEDSLVLIDAGVELHCYASDVTRTYPVGGRFEGAARDVYQAVLEAQGAAFAATRPGATLRSIHEAALDKLVDCLVELGALSGEKDELIETEAYKPFYMHNTSHFLGLDVHDMGDYSVDGKPRPLEPGMCFTVEPGLYFSTTEEKSPDHLRSIGVRIEDDLVITKDGFENLTAAIPKTVDDVESWMRG